MVQENQDKICLDFKEVVEYQGGITHFLVEYLLLPLNLDHLQLCKVPQDFGEISCQCLRDLQCTLQFLRAYLSLQDQRYVNRMNHRLEENLNRVSSDPFWDRGLDPRHRLRDGQLRLLNHQRLKGLPRGSSSYRSCR